MKRSITLMAGLLLSGAIALNAQKIDENIEMPAKVILAPNVDDVEVPAQLSIADWQQKISESILVYPNPSNGQFTIALSPEIKLSEIAVYDLTGRVVLQIQGNELLGREALKLDLGAHHTGMYLLVLRNGADTYVQRIVKN